MHSAGQGMQGSSLANDNAFHRRGWNNHSIRKGGGRGTRMDNQPRQRPPVVETRPEVNMFNNNQASDIPPEYANDPDLWMAIQMSM